MSETLFGDLQLKSGVSERVEGDSYLFEERNPLDETLLRDIETELSALTGCAKADRVRITVLGLDDFQRALKRIVPKRFQDRGLTANLRVLHDPRDPHHILIGPSALAGLNEGHLNVINDLLYHLLAATGKPSNQAFQRGVDDIIAEEIARRLDLPFFTGSAHYPGERAFVEVLIDACKDDIEDDSIEIAALLKKNPRQFFAMIYQSPFYAWWSKSVAADDRLSPYINLLESMTAPNAQLEGSFLSWASSCAQIYRDFRLEQRRKGKLSAAKRKEEG